jgi:hypothetical protein
MKKACWLVDELLTENARGSGFPSIDQAATELGHRVHKTKYKPFSIVLEGKPFEDWACVVTHGTIEFCKQVEKYWSGKNNGNWVPGMYFNNNVKNWSKFAPYIGDDLLNSDYVILPFGELVRRMRNIPHSACFVKPESGMKEFTGQVISSHTLDDDLKKLQPYHEIDPTTLCVISFDKSIKAEFRYVICNREVITGSEYRWDNVLDVRQDTHPFCDAMADKIAHLEWQPDSVYVCDVALVDTGNDAIKQEAKVIELNAFSCSGLYACDTYKIVKAVSKEAEREHAGLD